MACGGDGETLRYKTEMVTDASPDCPMNKIIRVVWRSKSKATVQDPSIPRHWE